MQKLSPFLQQQRGSILEGQGHVMSLRFAKMRVARGTLQFKGESGPRLQLST